MALFRILALAWPRVNIPSSSKTSPTALTCLVVSPNTSTACLTGKPSYCCRKSNRRETSGAFGCDVNFGTSSFIDCIYCHTMRIQSSPYNIIRSHMVFFQMLMFQCFNLVLLNLCRQLNTSD